MSVGATRSPSGTSHLTVMAVWAITSLTRAKSWKRVSPPATPVTMGSGSFLVLPWTIVSTSESMSRPNGDGSQSMAERKLK
jgi:hypothetical protein